VTYANITDVAARLGRPISDAVEVAQVNAWLGDVESMILAKIPTLVALVAAGAPSEATVVRVECQAVIRKVQNPDGKVAENIDDYGYRYNENARRGELFLTDEEWADLTPESPSAAFTIAPYGPAGSRTDAVDTDWS
jgi:hypothetical protein